MSALRVCVLAAALAAIALLVVHLRSEQTRCAARLLRLESQWIELRRERWALQTRAARLRAPQRVHDRIDALRSPVVPPDEQSVGRSRARLASDRAQE